MRWVGARGLGVKRGVGWEGSDWEDNDHWRDTAPKVAKNLPHSNRKRRIFELWYKSDC